MLGPKGRKRFTQCYNRSRHAQISLTDWMANLLPEQVLQACDAEFEAFDVFTDESIRQGIKTYSDWPTIPQLYVDGEFVGGSDIMIEMFQNGVSASRLSLSLSLSLSPSLLSISVLRSFFVLCSLTRPPPYSAFPSPLRSSRKY